MNDQTKILAAVVSGYLLGRTKQGKRALRLALWLSGGSGAVATALAQQARTGLERNPALAELLDQIRGPLAETGRRVLTSALEQRANALADSLHDRTEALSLPGGGKLSDVVDSGDQDDADQDGADQDDADQAGDDEEAPRSRATSDTGETGGGATRKSSRSAGRTKAGTTGGSTKRAGTTKQAGATKRAGTTKQAGSTRGTSRSTGQSRQSSTGSRSRGGSQTSSTRRRSGR